MSARVPALLLLALASTPTLTPEALAAAPRYRMVLDGTNAEQGVKTVSLVKNPAIQRGWVALSAAESATAGVRPTARQFHLSTATDAAHRQVLTGPALLPGQEILRLDKEGNPFYIQFDAATIEGTARQFAAQARHTSTNQDHATPLAGNVVYESWLVADPANDKAAALGLDVPAGTWMLSVHIPDADYWQNEVVSGNKLGFSIEGLFTTEQLTLSAAAPAPTPVKKNWITALWAALTGMGEKDAAALRTALGMEKLTDGRTLSIDDTTGAVTVMGEDGQPGAALPDGEYDLEGGGKLVVKDGMRENGEPSAVAQGADAPKPGDKPTDPPAPGTDAAPATTDERLAKVEKQVGEILDAVKKLQPDPATEPAAPKLAAQLHEVALADLGPKLQALKLDAIDLEDGSKLTYNAVTRQLTDKDGALVKSGYFAAKDGSYFSVSTDQYIYQISKPTYDAVYLQQVELAEAKVKLAAAEAKLATTPAAGKLHLTGDLTTTPGGTPAAASAGTATQKLALSTTARLRELQATD